MTNKKPLSEKIFDKKSFYSETYAHNKKVIPEILKQIYKVNFKVSKLNQGGYTK